MTRSLCIDWGSTNFRAWRFDGTTPREFRHIPDAGMRNAPPQGFARWLQDTLGDWLAQVDQVVLSGMITSRNGWIESPYLPCPALLSDLPRHGVHHRLAGLDVHFLPGLSQSAPQADVMRGEELQILGAMRGEGCELVVLPGTHSKWVHLRDGQVLHFGTWMTGELFALLLDQSLAGRLASGDQIDPAGYALGLRAAASGQVLGPIFAARAAVLLGQLRPDQVRGYLSGLLIGTEIAEARSTGFDAPHITLVAAPALADRYAQGLGTTIGTPLTLVEDATQRGFARVLAHLLTPSAALT